MDVAYLDGKIHGAQVGSNADSQQQVKDGGLDSSQEDS